MTTTTTAAPATAPSSAPALVPGAPLVSIVVVCMDNLENLRPCLRSIHEYTRVSHETLVVAYLFSPENLRAARGEFPWATFIESNEIRGFSENNNLALRRARGRFCLVLNDDTRMEMPVADALAATFDALPAEAAIVSPVIVAPDGRVLLNGKEPLDWLDVVLEATRLPWPRLRRRRERWTGRTGVYRTWNITGACFMIKTDAFRDAGWFDEYYFFAPEDIALSTLLNERGRTCHVNAGVQIVHLEGMTAPSTSPLQTATRPAGFKGAVHLYSRGGRSLPLRIFLAGFFTVQALAQCAYHFVKSLFLPRRSAASLRNRILAVGDWHTALNMFNRKTPKEIFLHYCRKNGKIP